jgi:MFS family permease
MVEDFGVAKDGTQVAYYAGLITAVFSICEAISSIFWGMLSDKIGRKPVIIMGLLGTTISLLTFGLSPNYYVAMFARGMSGALNGNVGVIKSIVAEMTDETNRPEAFSYMGVMFGFGCILGPLLGGYLSKPAERYPDIFGNITLLQKFPYFLPCAVSALLCFCSMVFGSIYLEETLKSKKSVSMESNPLINQETITIQEVENYGTIELESSTKTNKSDSFLQQIKSIPKNTWILIIAQAMLHHFIVILDEGTIFWGAAPIKDGGLGFTPPDFASFMASGGLSMFFIQFTIFSPLNRKFGILRIYRKIHLFFALIAISTPFITSVASVGSSEVKVLVSLLYILRSMISMFAFGGSDVLLSNSNPLTSILGLINGLSIFFICTSRAIAPTIAGWIFSWSLSNNLGFPFDIHFTFFVAAFFALVNHIIAQFVKDGLN